MAKIKLSVSATIEDTFKDFIVSRKAKGLAEKTVQRYTSQFYAVAQAYLPIPSLTELPP